MKPRRLLPVLLLVAACAPRPTPAPATPFLTTTGIPASPTISSTPTFPPSATAPATAIPSLTPRPTIPLVPTASPSGPPGQSPVPPAPSPVILSFTAEPPELDPGDPVTLTWTSTGGASATLYRLLPTGQLGSMWQVAPQGALTLPTNPADRNSLTFMLYVANEAGVWVQASVMVTLRCPDTWFFTPAPAGRRSPTHLSRCPPEGHRDRCSGGGCPGQPPIYSAAAQQQFEGGLTPAPTAGAV